ncbi:MAG: site-specific DNA-methyltransferase [Dictyoglomus sp.]|nr:site-specific DNA-methyltransferase [Dictyoglomus sp.]MDW8188866.1 site-specific DNA-methyltransferase [Dictyoglomus sp.]
MFSNHRTHHLLIFGDAENMYELKDESIHLVVTSPPYYNAPFDYPDLFSSYDEYLHKMKKVVKEIKRVLINGRIVCLVCDDILINSEKYPVVSDLTQIFLEEGFIYRDKIIWLKPEGYVRISRRSGVLLQHPYPMYFYPDNLQESILIFQKGKKFNYSSIPEIIKEASKIDVKEYLENKWYLNVWNITNVLPTNNRLEEGIAAFPEELPYRLIKLFSYVGETVLDPFMGSGTTNKISLMLGRNSVGYDIDKELVNIVKEKLGINKNCLFEKNYEIEIIIREDAKQLRSWLSNKVNKLLKNNGKGKTKKIIR